MSFEIDHASLLVGVPGAATLSSIARAIAAAGLTLGFTATDETVAEWLAGGARGAASFFADPADHLIAGLTAKMTDGRRLHVRPCPRRAVGPDLTALFVGAGERFGAIEHVWLRVHAKDARRVALPTEGLALDVPMTTDEAELLDAIERELTMDTAAG